MTRWNHGDFVLLDARLPGCNNVSTSSSLPSQIHLLRLLLHLLCSFFTLPCVNQWCQNICINMLHHNLPMICLVTVCIQHSEACDNTTNSYTKAFSSEILDFLMITSCRLVVCVCVRVFISAPMCVHASLMGLQVPALCRTEPVAILLLKEGDQMARVRPWASGLTSSVWCDRLPVTEPGPPAKTLLQRINMN